MSAVDTYSPRLKDSYENEIRPRLKEELGLDSIMQAPRIENTSALTPAVRRSSSAGASGVTGASSSVACAMRACTTGASARTDAPAGVLIFASDDTPPSPGVGAPDIPPAGKGA